MTDTLKPSEVTLVSFVLGGYGYVSRAALEAGVNHSLRLYTKAGKPRFKRESSTPLYTGPALLIGVPIPPPRFPLVGVFVVRDGAAACMSFTKAYDGDVAHFTDVADLYAAIEGNTRAEVRRFAGGGGPSRTVAIRAPRSKTRRMLASVYHGSTHSTYHHTRERLIAKTPAPFPGDHYGPRLERYSSSVHVVINGRAGLFRDAAPVKATPHDLTAPWPNRPGIVRKVHCDASRLPG